LIEKAVYLIWIELWVVVLKQAMPGNVFYTNANGVVGAVTSNQFEPRYLLK
jgi:hypothetical protein